MSPGRRRAVGVALLVAAVAAGLAVAAIGLSGRPSLALPNRSGPHPHDTRDKVIALAAMVLGVLMIVRAKRLAAPHQRLTYRLVGAALVTVPALLPVANRIRRLQAETDNTPGRVPVTTLPSTAQSTVASLPPSTPPPPRSSQHFDLGFVGVAVAAGVLLAAAAMIGLAVYRAWVRRPGRYVEFRDGEAPRPGAVLDSAAGAIALGGSPRERVIAAYEAMEAALGGRRARQLAPVEWLAELARSDPAIVEPANALTALFERARFSTAPVSEADAAGAAAHLRGLQSVLGVRG